MEVGALGWELSQTSLLDLEESRSYRCAPHSDLKLVTSIILTIIDVHSLPFFLNSRLLVLCIPFLYTTYSHLAHFL